jgi:signal transduction histidine kinase
LERALLSSLTSDKLGIVREIITIDRDFRVWALRTVEQRTARTINHVDEAADWLAENLVSQLDASLESDISADAAQDIESRLPALVAKLADCQRALAGFDRRLEREKLESLKELAYGASHEVNNPLANIAARAQTMLEDEEDSERARKLVAIHRQAMRAHEMISDLMLFARPPKRVPKQFDLQKLVARVVEELGELGAEYNVEIAVEVPDTPIEVLADETQIGVAIHAVVKNAVEAAAHGGQVTVATRIQSIGEMNIVEVSVRDDGPGISEHVRRHMFDPFFSGREAGRGLGFGMSKCWRIVTDHGGEVIVGNQQHGAEITIRLPFDFRPSNVS